MDKPLANGETGKSTNIIFSNITYNYDYISGKDYESDDIGGDTHNGQNSNDNKINNLDNDENDHDSGNES